MLPLVPVDEEMRMEKRRKMNKRSRAAVPFVLCVAMLAACGGRGQTSTSQVQAVEVQITLSDFHLTSSIMMFAPGALYHFTVINTGKTAHELMLLSSTMKTMNMSGMSMSAMDTMTLVHLEQIHPGETKTLDYTFVLRAAGPHPEFSCHLPGHYEAGMHLDVTVGQEKVER